MSRNENPVVRVRVYSDGRMTRHTDTRLDHSVYPILRPSHNLPDAEEDVLSPEMLFLAHRISLPRMENRKLLYLLSGLGVIFFLAIALGIKPSISLPIPFSIDYLMFLGGQIVDDAINAAVSGILSLPWWVLAAIVAFLVVLGAGYSDASESDSTIIPVPENDSSSATSDAEWMTEITRLAATGLNNALAGVTAVGHGVTVALTKAGRLVNDSNLISIDFALAQITGVSVTVAGFVGKLIGGDSDED